MTVSYGKADLLIGLDPLEAVRAIDGKSVWRVASPERTIAIINTDPTPTIRTLMGRDGFKVDDLERTLKAGTRADQYFSARITSLCERIFGTKMYANITMLGVAYQRGLIPVSLEAMKEGIRRTIRADFKKNLRAFDIGRKLVSHPDLFAEHRVGVAAASRAGPGPTGSDRQDAGPTSLARTVREKAAYLNMRLLGKRRALRSEIAGAAGKRRLPASYANFVLGNRVVLLPTYGPKARDAEAARVLRRCFPGRVVVLIDCREMVYGYGSLHCATQQVPR